jgi:hypothetical protein
MTLAIAVFLFPVAEITFSKVTNSLVNSSTKRF